MKTTMKETIYIKYVNDVIIRDPIKDMVRSRAALSTTQAIQMTRESSD